MQVLLSGTDFPHASGEFTRPKTVPYYGFFCFTTPFVYQTEDGLQTGKPGQILINPPGSLIHHGPIASDQSFRNHWLHISADFSRLLERYPLPLDRAFLFPKPELIAEAIHRLTREQLLRQAGWEEAVDCILTQLVIEIHRFSQQSPERSATVRLEEARNTFLASPQQPWTLEEMARLSGYSPSRFSCLYTAAFGKSPKAELLEVRITKATQMLQYSDLSVSTVAAACGFQSLYYFSKYFRKHMGVSPSQWALENKK